MPYLVFFKVAIAVHAHETERTASQGGLSPDDIRKSYYMMTATKKNYAIKKIDVKSSRIIQHRWHLHFYPASSVNQFVGCHPINVAL